MVIISERLSGFINNCVTNFDSISVERKALLSPLVTFIQSKLNTKELVNLVFICTHNSRRSHLSQVWAQVAASYFNFPSVKAYSGGTETTAVYSSIIQTLTNRGLEIASLSKEENPIYSLKYSDNNPPIICFSKPHNHPLNPKSGFAAVMTCTDADENCPFIPNATRISLPYNDPKVFDGMPEEEEKYLERSIDIATEMFYVFSKVIQ